MNKFVKLKECEVKIISNEDGTETKDIAESKDVMININNIFYVIERGDFPGFCTIGFNNFTTIVKGTLKQVHRKIWWARIWHV